MAWCCANAPGRESHNEITTFDSTRLAIHELPIALAAVAGAEELDLPRIEL
jgi:ornithine cyclodeaminase/alanine dehydrogenase-like protein (mu-crystallin family)